MKKRSAYKEENHRRHIKWSDIWRGIHWFRGIRLQSNSNIWLPQYLLDYFDEVQELGDGNCLFRALARGAFDDNERYDELRDAIWDFILALRNTFSSFVENEDVEAYIYFMRKDGEYGGEIEIIAFSMMLQKSVWIYDQESSLDSHLQYENINSTHRINLRYYEDDLHYNSLRIKEGYKAIDFDEAMEKVCPEEAEEPIITGQNEKNRAFWGEKKGEYTDQLLKSIYEL